MKKFNGEVTGKVIGCAIEVHRMLGPGLFENAYEQCLAHEFHLQGVPFKLQVPVGLKYKNVTLNCAYRMDFLVDDCVVVELKSVERLTKVHEAQTLTYMKLAKLSTGLLINFNELRLVDGIKRFKL